jgi:hypothetical protein
VVINQGVTPIFLGGSGVTTSTGALLAGVVGASKTIAYTGAIYGIASGAAQTVSLRLPSIQNAKYVNAKREHVLFRRGARHRCWNDVRFHRGHYGSEQRWRIADRKSWRGCLATSSWPVSPDWIKFSHRVINRDAYRIYE